LKEMKFVILKGLMEKTKKVEDGFLLRTRCQSMLKAGCLINANAHDVGA
jgi:hypothetical protein